VLPGGGEPLPYGADWAMRVFCNSPTICFMPFYVLSKAAAAEPSSVVS
jgi:hypothetical protein